jgi:hypothetical protein
VVGYETGALLWLWRRDHGAGMASSLLPAAEDNPGERQGPSEVVKRIALKAIELTAAATIVSLLFLIAETPLRLAEYRMMGGD